MVLHYPKTDAGEDDEWLDIAIPETNVTHIKNDKLMTEALEGMEWTLSSNLLQITIINQIFMSSFPLLCVL